MRLRWMVGLAVAMLAVRAFGADAGLGESVVIKDVPHVKQRPDFCGEACAEMYLRKLGKSISQDQVFNISGLDPAQGRGCYTAELKNALTAIGFKVGAVWYGIENAKMAEQIAAQSKAMVEDLRAGVPSIVCMHYGEGAKAPEHFRLVVGYDAKKDRIIYQEPAEDGAAYSQMGRGSLKSSGRWRRGRRSPR